MTEDEVPPSSARRPEPVRLVGANVPADQGLASLGLIMQLMGGLSAAVTAYLGFQLLFKLSRRSELLIVLLLMTLGVVRALMHRSAGTGLLYGTAALAGVRRYVVVGLTHSALCAAALITQGLATTRVAVSLGLALATWPLLLGVLLQLPWMRRFEQELPVAEDKGFEGAAVLMTVMSLAGIAGSLLMLEVFFSLSGAMQGMGVLVMLTMLLLLARSIAHLVAGITGLRNVPLDTAVERVSQYATLGVVSAFVTAGVMLIILMSESLAFDGLLLVAVAAWVLALWPMALRRLFAERQFANLLADRKSTRLNSSHNPASRMPSSA
jgi:hypothetical protein